MQNTEKIYVKNAHLSGYRSITNLNINFNKDLNIIIGKNSAGKTNFLSFLDKSLKFDFEGLSNFSSDISIEGKGTLLRYNASKKIEPLGEKSFKPKLNLDFEINGAHEELGEDSLEDLMVEKHLTFNVAFLCHGVPKSYKIVDEPFTYTFEKDLALTADIYGQIVNKHSPTFLKNILLNLVYLKISKHDSIFATEVDDIKSEFKRSLDFIYQIRDTLRTYTPINDLRFSDNFNVYQHEEKKITIDNLFLEFKVNDDWLPFKFLSDGTKRTFYLISELFEFKDQGIYYANSRFQFPNESISSIFLIEEPELGIHPHQFMKILKYIKNKSRQSQVFITTHSPQSLDILEDDELDKIIITYSDSKNQTMMRKLSENEVSKAKKYIEDEFLSDYWLYSDLEN